MKPISVAVWGVGEHVKENIFPVFENLEVIKPLGFWTRSKETQNTYDDWGEYGPYPSRDDMLSDSGLDVIYVATPTGLHFKHGEAVLEAKKHLWMEKSFTDSLPKTRKLLNLAKNKNKQVEECFMFIHHPQFKRLEELLKKETLGEIGSIHSCFGFPHRDSNDFRYNPELGGGALLDAGAYPIRLLLSLVTVEAEDILENSLSSLHYGSHNIDERGMISGTVGQKFDFFLEWGFGRTYRNEVTVWGQDSLLQAERIFSKGNSTETYINLKDSNQSENTLTIPPANHFIRMFESFCDDLRTENYKENYDIILQQAKVIDHIFNKHGGKS